MCLRFNNADNFIQISSLWISFPSDSPVLPVAERFGNLQTFRPYATKCSGEVADPVCSILRWMPAAPRIEVPMHHRPTSRRGPRKDTPFRLAREPETRLRSQD